MFVTFNDRFHARFIVFQLIKNIHPISVNFNNVQIFLNKIFRFSYGKCDFIKAGAVASLVKSDGRVDFIRENSMPLGVLEIESLPVRTVFLEKDTYIVMMTDGVCDNIGDRKRGEECVAGILQLMEVSSGKEVSDSIMMSAVAEGIPKDDMTVTAIKISGKD